MKKLLSVLLLTATFSLAACVPINEPTESADSGEGKGTGSIYYLNFKPEIAPVYEKIAEA